MESLQLQKYRPSNRWLQTVLVASTGILFSSFGVFEGLDRWVYGCIAALTGIESLFSQLPNQVAGSAVVSFVIDPASPQDPFFQAPSLVTILGVAAAAWISLWASVRFRPLIAFGLIATVTACYGLFSFMMVLSSHGPFELGVIPLTLSLGYGVSITLATKQVRRRQRYIHQLLSRHVPPALAEKVWQARELFLPGGSFHSQKLTATVLFVDMQGFTTLSETLNAKRVIEWMNEYMETMARLVMEHGGVVEEYFGNALKANFGAPFARVSPEEIAQDASQAVACALAMGETLQMVNHRWHDLGYPRIDMHVGISTGEVTAVCVGHTPPLKLTTMGPVVHLAGQLERISIDPDPPASGPGFCRILIGPGTASRISGRQFWLQPIRTVQQESADSPTEVYRVYGKNERRLFSTGQNMRASSRVDIMTPVTLTQGVHATGLTSNISVGGMAVCRLGGPVSIGATTILRFEVPGSSQSIKATGTVVWAHQDQAGIAFAPLPPLDHHRLESFVSRQAAA
jgi:class 3 adenylate cyclase